MNLKKFIVIPLILFSLFIYSCDKETRDDLSDKLDTAVQKIGEQVDTLANKISEIGTDTLFRDIKVTEVDTAGLAPDNFRSKLNEVFKDYEDVKDALAKNDTSDAIMQSNQLKKSLENVMDEDLMANQKTGWSRSRTNIEKTATEIASARTIADQRKSFATLTNEMLSMIKTYGLKDKTVYHLECPGAGGGSWLTSSKSTDNPFGGSVARETAGTTDTDTARTPDTKSEECARVKEAWKFE
jgi:hypothetical protein